MSELTDDRLLPPILTSQGGVAYNKPWLDYWERRALKAEAALRAAASTSTEGAGVKAVAWRYRIAGANGPWCFVDGEWPADWGTDMWERQPLTPPASKVTTDEAEERG